jgi:uncharacterized lipoprotein
MRATLFCFVLSGVVMLSACDNSGRQLALNLDRAAGYIGTATALIERQATAGTLSPKTAERLAGDLQQLNRLNGDLIAAVTPLKSADGSRLALDGDNRARLLAILTAARRVVVSRLEDPDFLTLADNQRREITAIYTQIETLIQLSAEIVQSAKGVKQ